MKEFVFTGSRLLMGRLERGDDLLEQLTAFCHQHDIRAGAVWAIGAVERARLGYFDQAAGSYRTREWEQPLEIVSLSGNVSEKEGQPFAHLHAVLADEQGACHGGHLLEGCRVFACEFVVMKLEGEIPRRTTDPATGLALW